MAKKRKPKFKGQKLPPKRLKSVLIQFFSKEKGKFYSLKQINNKLKICNSSKSVQIAIEKLIDDHVVFELDGRYKYDTKSSYASKADSFPKKEYVGRVDMIKSGDAYVLVEELDDDVYVPSRYLKGAMNKDRVRIAVPQVPGKRRPEGKVIEVVERSLTHVIGKIETGHKYHTLYPINRGVADQIYIALDDLNGLKDGEFALAEIIDYGGNSKKMFAKVERKLERATDNDVAMQAILLNAGFDLDFPPEVLEQVKAIELDINDEEIAKRRDFREVTTFTIDPLTAKDFDDALSYQKLDNGNFEIGVHIADVTHYLPEGSPLDKEAAERTTSVYLVDRVLPMLPEKLSNNLCSLNPHVDRYTFSAVFTFNEKFEVVNQWFGKAIIHSDRRFTYEEAQEVIETGEGDYVEEIRLMNAVAHHLRKKKFKNGAIAFESEEIQFKLDENGKPVSLYVKERKDAHMLVEDFMLLANRSVAKYIAKKSENQVPFVYRVHDLPNEEKLMEFASFAKEMGFTMNLKTPKEIAKSFNDLTKKAETVPMLDLLKPLAIRTMSKAVYTTDNIGHYGLGFEYYGHFTSPIRRYADVLVHRVLFENLEKTKRRDKSELETKAKHISTKEKSAAEAERESIKYKQAEYISERIGQTFSGIVSGIIEKGFFVALDESRAEGLIEFKTLPQRYEISNSRYRAIAPSGDSITMGQRCEVEVIAVDMEKRLIDMRLISFEDIESED